MNYIESKLYQAYLKRDFDIFLVYCNMLANMSKAKNISPNFWAKELKVNKNEIITLGDILCEFNKDFSEKLSILQKELKAEQDLITSYSEQIKQKSSAKIQVDKKLNNKKKQSESKLKDLRKKYSKLVQPSQDALRLLYEIHQKNQEIENNRLLSKLTADSEVQGDSERRTAAHPRSHEDSSTESTEQFTSSTVEFRKKSNKSSHLFQATSKFKWYHAIIQWFLSWFSYPPLPTTDYKLTDKQRETIISLFPESSQLVESTNNQNRVHYPPLNMQAAHLFSSLKQTKPVAPKKSTVKNNTLDNLNIVQVYQAQQQTIVEQQTLNTEFEQAVIQERLAVRVDAQIAQLKQDQSKIIQNTVYIEGITHSSPLYSKLYNIYLAINADKEKVTRQLKTANTCLHLPGRQEPINFNLIKKNNVFLSVTISENALEYLKQEKNIDLINKGRELFSFNPANGQFILPVGMFYELTAQTKYDSEKEPHDYVTLHIKYNKELESAQKQQLSALRETSFIDQSMQTIDPSLKESLKNENLTSILLASETTIEVAKNALKKEFASLTQKHQIFLDNPFTFADDAEARSFYGVIALLKQVNPPEKFYKLLDILCKIKQNEPTEDVNNLFRVIICNHEWAKNSDTTKRYYDQTLVELDLSLLGYLEQYPAMQPIEKTWLKYFICSQQSREASLLEIFKNVQILSNLAVQRKINLPEPIKKRSNWTMPFTYLGGYYETPSLLGLIQCLTFASTPQALTQIPLIEWPQTNNDAIYMLRAGYTVLHRDMMLDWHSNMPLTELLEKNYTSNDTDITISSHPLYIDANPIYIYATNLVRLNPIINNNDYNSRYKALWLRYIALNKDPRYFDAARKKWDTFQQANFIDLEHGSDEEQECRFQQACAFALQLPSKINYRADEDRGNLDLPDIGLPTTTAKEFAPIWQRITSQDALMALDASEHGLQRNTNFQYKTENNQVLFEENEINTSIKNFTKTDRLSAHISAINKNYAMVVMLKPKELLDRLKSLKDNKDTPLYLKILYLMEAETRLTKRQLRLEQVLVILHALENQALYDIKTSEGKTTILKFIALLSALDGKKVNIITHNEFLAKEGVLETSSLAKLCGLHVANKDEPNSSSADILYSEASHMVFDDMLAKLNNTSLRKADLALVDEFDQLVLDMATTDMEIPYSNSTIAINENFLLQLAKLILENPNLSVTELMEMQNINKLQESQEYLKFWIEAGVQAAKLRININYVLFKKSAEEAASIQMIHQETHGRRDPQSIWGKGVHQMVAALEIIRNTKSTPQVASLVREKSIVIPPFTPAIAQENIIDYLKSYEKICGFTATPGDVAEISNFLCNVLANNAEAVPLISRIPSFLFLK